jgi:16S rRNA (cytosine967-C5)-methyltransferase
MERLYAEIAEEGTFDRDNLWRMFAVWAVLRGYPDWRQLEGTPERKIKGRFDTVRITDWMDELGVKN